MINFKILIFLALQMAILQGQTFLEKRSYAIPRLPDTNFNCKNKVLGNYYADSETECQMFHVCVQVLGVGVQDFRFLCPNGTAFDQEAQICTDWGDVDCHQALFSNGLSFDIFRIKVQKHELKSKIKTESKEDPLLLQNLSQDNNDEIFKGSHSSNFFGNNRGADNLNDYKDVSFNQRTLTTEKSTVISERIAMRKKFQPMQLLHMTRKGTFRSLSGSKIMDSDKKFIMETTISSISNNEGRNTLNEYFKAGRSDFNSKESNFSYGLNKTKLSNYYEKQFNSNNTSDMLNPKHFFYQSTTHSYYNKTKHNYQNESHTQKIIRQPNRILTSENNYSQNMTKNISSPYNDNKKSHNWNSKSNSKNPYYSYPQSQKFETEKLVTEFPKILKLNPGININKTPTSTNTTINALYIIPPNGVKTNKKLTTILSNNNDIPTTFRPSTKKNFYNNLVGVPQKKTNENLFLQQNSVSPENKSNIAVMSHNISSILENNNDEELLKTSNSYNIGAYKINHIPIHSTQRYLTENLTPNTNIIEKNTKLRNRGLIKSLQHILPEANKTKINLDIVLSKPNCHKNFKKLNNPKESLKIQTTRPSKQITKSMNNNINTLFPNQYQNNYSIRFPNLKTDHTDKGMDSKLSAKHHENTSEHSRHFNITDTLFQKPDISHAKHQNKRILKINENEDTSYDYAYYDELKDYGGLDIFSDFEKIRKP